MRIPFWILLVGAGLALTAVVIAGMAMIDPNAALLTNAGFEFETVTPNADGDRDIVPFRYTLARPAVITLTFENTAGQRFNLRSDQDRMPGDHEFLFSGVVDGFTLPDDAVIDGTIERRLIPDGDYTWTLTAMGTRRDETETQTGKLLVQDGDVSLPAITSFAMTSTVFTPNQDGVKDRVGMSVVILKEVDVTAWLLSPDGDRFSIAPREDVKHDDQGFRYDFDYEGGVDMGADPPNDGTYTIRIEAQDAVGQRVARTAELTIVNGGKPYAEIVGQPIGPDVVLVSKPYEERYFSSAEGLGELIAPPEDSEDPNFNSVTVPVGDMLVFKLVVENYGASPIRTSGPPPGTVYQQTQLAASLGDLGYQQPGVWRVGIQCETSSDSYPWRWALGDETTLTSEYDAASGNTYLYLPPGERVVVWGAVRMTELVENFNPQTCYAGLIHEGVNISVRNSVVGARSILLQSPDQVGEFNSTPQITPTATPDS
jgi:hypothetical protein